jgi:NTP pyrophosphatase (non-canonical NTP hydrolase)
MSTNQLDLWVETGEETGRSFHSLAGLILSYYEFRGLKKPDAEQAFKFLISEIGEMSDAMVSQEGGWTRNSPGRERSIEDEIGDTLQMLVVTALQLGLDPFDCMINKWKKKGWKPA